MRHAITRLDSMTGILVDGTTFEAIKKVGDPVTGPVHSAVL